MKINPMIYNDDFNQEMSKSVLGLVNSRFKAFCEGNEGLVIITDDLTTAETTSRHDFLKRLRGGDWKEYKNVQEIFNESPDDFFVQYNEIDEENGSYSAVFMFNKDKLSK